MIRILLMSLVLMGFFAGAETSYAGERHLLDLPGRIAYIGSDYNIYTLSLHEEGISALTLDASNTRRYMWPTWSDGGKLAYFCCEPAFTNRIVTETHISPDGINYGDLVYDDQGALFTYAYWSPRDCAAGSNCRDLAVLLSQITSSRFSVEVFRSSDEGTSRLRVGQGAPFYYSWSPDGTRLLLQRDNGRLDVYHVNTEILERLSQLPGTFQAPAWSPVDDRLLFGMAGEDGITTDLVIFANDTIRVLQSGLVGLVSFSWSPDGNSIAYRTATNEGFSQLIVLDAETGEITMETASREVIAFFWSPDSARIAFVALPTPQGSFSVSRGDILPVSLPAQQTDGLVWSVIEVDGGNARRYGAFIPTQEMIYLLSFFDQFSQSHRIWSPDSTHIVFSEVTPDGARVISVLDMTRNDAVPFFIADGLIGIWSYS
jgi:TolB protein